MSRMGTGLVYEGERTLTGGRGKCYVTIMDSHGDIYALKAVPESYPLAGLSGTESEKQFDWGCSSTQAKRLALAILIDVTGISEDDLPEEMVIEFRKHFVEKFETWRWTLTEDLIMEWLNEEYFKNHPDDQ